jgi:hypothetical protein
MPSSSGEAFGTSAQEGSMNTDASHLHALSISVPITRSLERLLHRAATNRSQTAEELAKRILCDWLLKERSTTLHGPAHHRRTGADSWLET